MESRTISQYANGKTRQSHRYRFPLGNTLSLYAPLVQAPLGACDGPSLAAAVSRAGALGCLTIHAPERLALQRDLAQIRRRTTRPVLLAFTAPYEPEEILDTTFAMGFRHFLVFWWNAPRLAPRIRALGGTVFWQVGSVEQIQAAILGGANVLVAQGREAGGQVRSSLPREEILALARELAGLETPIVSGGGLATRADVKRVLSLGASAALLGTRFLVSQEASCPWRYKARLARAMEKDLVLDTRAVGDWPCAPRRRLLTAFREDTPGLFAGRGLDRIHRVLPVREIIRSLTP